MCFGLKRFSRPRASRTAPIDPEAPALSIALPASPYQPLRIELNEIRVAHLHPGEWTDKISCSLVTISLEDLPSNPALAYEALSYVWAAEPGFEQILINDEPYEITKNLFFVLRRLRKVSEERVIWADALCINQNDDVEKGHQVATMGTIYRLCTRVYLWLGETKNPNGSLTNIWTLEECLSSSHTSPEMQQDMAYQAFQLLREFSEGRHWNEMSCFQDDGEVRGLDPKVLDAVGLMMSSEWFTRLWVVQEALLPHEAVILWGCFSELWSFLPTIPLTVFNHANNPCCVNFWKQMQSNHRTVLDNVTSKIDGLLLPEEPSRSPGFKFDRILWSFVHKTAARPIDKIYGLLGLPCSSAFTITPDYSTSKERLYTDVSLLCMREEGYLDVLKGRKKRSSGLPSWVHDWSFPIGEYERMAEYGTITLSCYAASLDLRANIRVDDLNRLTLRGVYIDRVVHANKSLDCYPTSRRMSFELFFDWYEKCQLPSWQGLLRERYKTLPKTWESAFRATITSDLYPGSARILSKRASPHEAEEDAEVFESWLSAGKAEYWTRLREEHGLKQFDYTIYQVSFYRALFITETGYMGMGKVEEGDEIWVLLGGDVPFILRPVPGSSEYTLVGDCYLHGIMDGEAVADLEGKLRSVVLI